ncbi:hypothetical protein L9F63_020013, partial [Diploptera punctata]
PVEMSGGQTLTCWIYLLKKFKPTLLDVEMFSNYSSSGPHGRPYGERYLRDPSYDYKREILIQPD